MNNFFSYVKRKISKMDIWDISFLKLDAFAIGMVAGAFYPAFVKGNIIVFTIIISVLTTLLVANFLKK